MYQVSNLGQIKSLRNNKILKQQTACGYSYVCLCNKNKKELKRVHRIVANEFILNDHNYSDVNHIDGNKLNNNVNNLEWCTRQYNIQHSWNTGLSKSHKPINMPKGKNHKQSKKVNQYDINGKLIKKWDCIRDIERELGYLASFIVNACKGRVKTAYGYVWKYQRN